MHEATDACAEEELIMSEAWSLAVLAALAYLFWRIGRPDRKKEDK